MSSSITLRHQFHRMDLTFPHLNWSPARSNKSTLRVSSLPVTVWSRFFCKKLNKIIDYSPSACSPANTDLRNYVNLSDKLYRISPTVVTPITRAGLHGVEERTTVEEYHNVIQVFVKVITNADEAIISRKPNRFHRELWREYVLYVIRQIQLEFNLKKVLRFSIN